jgi:hypothetical protein
LGDFQYRVDHRATFDDGLYNMAIVAQPALDVVDVLSDFGGALDGALFHHIWYDDNSMGRRWLEHFEQNDAGAALLRQ